MRKENKYFLLHGFKKEYIYKESKNYNFFERMNDRSTIKKIFLYFRNDE